MIKRQDLTALHTLHHLGVLGPAVGHLPAGKHLPAEYAVRPHIAFARETGEI